MAQVKIVTDSTADLKAEWYQEHDIKVVPLNVHIGDELFKDQIDLDAAAFFQRLASSKILPRSSQPSPADFEDVYRPLLQGGHPIVSIHISEKLSGTLSSARMAREMIGEGDIRLVDSTQASVALGLIVMAAARASASGAGADAVEAAAADAVQRVRVYFALDTLEFLIKGGRVGKAQGFVGSLLSMKPILSLSDGEVVPNSRVRGRKRVIPELERLFLESLDQGGTADVIIIHGEAPETAQQLSETLNATGKVTSLQTADIGAVIGVHCGPGVVGFAMLKGSA